MIKTQIQLPDELYRQVKAFSRQREWSLAETFRRGVEQLFEQYPVKSSPKKVWELPRPKRMGCKPIGHEEIKRHAQEDAPLI